MAGEQPTIIKKYANRRLYHTGTSTYVTLEDLADMVKSGEDFVVTDAKTGEDITRSVLGQIIFEQEGRGGQPLLPHRLPAPAHPLLRRPDAGAAADLPGILALRLHPQPGSAARADGARAFRRRAGRDRGADAAQHGDVLRGDADVDAVRAGRGKFRQTARTPAARRARRNRRRARRRSMRSAVSSPRCRRRSRRSPERK